jgi:hypothetical protein
MKVYALYTCDYSGESAIEVYTSEEKCQKDMEKDMEYIVKELEEQGYTLCFDGYGIYVADSSIYYEWKVYETELRK